MKMPAKKLMRFICGVVVAPAVLCCRLQSWMSGFGTPGSDCAFAGWTQLFSLLPGTSGVYLRHAFLRGMTTCCGDDACVSFGTVFSHAGISIGRGAYIGNFCTIGDVTIEDDVLIASHVSLMNGCRQHGIDRLDIPIRDQPGVFEPITIGNGSWIGEKATVAASVGRHCVIGAGAVVLKPVPDFAIAVGVPARIIADRRTNGHSPHSLLPTPIGERAQRAAERDDIESSLPSLRPTPGGEGARRTDEGGPRAPQPG